MLPAELKAEAEQPPARWPMAMGAGRQRNPTRRPGTGYHGASRRSAPRAAGPRLLLRLRASFSKRTSFPKPVPARAFAKGRD